MIDYSNMPEDSGAPRRWGLLAVGLYCAVVILSMWLVRCDSRAEEVEDASSGTLVISFGDVAESSGESLQREQRAVSPTTPKPQLTTPQLTDDRNEVETTQPQKAKQEVVAERETPKSAEAKVEERPREVNKRALFPGTSSSQSDKGEGESKDTPANGVAGSDRGTPGMRGELGEGLTGNYPTLEGRSLIGALPRPSYNSQAQGRVVIEITVDQKGRVTSARPRLTNSTTNNSRLIAAAREAALKARFDQSGELIQRGTITYNFKLN